MASPLNTFNWIAPAYDKLVNLVFGSTLLNAQLTFIDVISDNDSILILGGGSGQFLKTITNQKPGARICYIEASQKMLALSQSCVPENSRVDFIHGTEDNIPNRKFDVVITNFFLDLFPSDDLELVVEKVDRHLVSGGRWIVTDFENSSRISHRLLLASMYLFFRIANSIRAVNLPDWLPIVKSKGLTVVHEKKFMKGFVKSSVFVKA